MRDPEEFKEIDLLAKEAANKGGTYPRAADNRFHIAWITGVAVYVLLLLFSASVGVRTEAVELQMALFVVFVGGLVYLFLWKLQKEWFKRYYAAFDEIEKARVAERARSEEVSKRLQKYIRPRDNPADDIPF
jgi:hypothetical protein